MKCERGQVMVIVALAMTAMLAMSALVLDGGYAYLQRRRMQNAADAGALAGARELCSEEGNPEATAVDYAQRNRAEDVDEDDVDIDGNTVTVTAHTTFDTFFAGVIGVPEMSISAEAKASCQPAKSTTGLRPIAVEEKDYDFGTEYTIWHSEPITDSQRGWLDFDGGGGGAFQLRDWVTNGYGDEISIDDEVEGEPGEKTSVLQEVEDLIGKTVVCGAYDQMHKEHGKWYYHISFFVAFEITDVKSTGSPKWIKGKCKPLVVNGEWGGPDHGVRVVKLTR
ncbi:MAG: Tad domain-containing protein [Chloroflexota bacterium]|nr:Tad domain-containing protein [Chloroflexota bacterium]